VRRSGDLIATSWSRDGLACGSRLPGYRRRAGGASRPRLLLVGAELCDVDEARMIAALAATLDPARFECHGEYASVACSATAPATTPRCRRRLHLPQPPGFAGGAGCALHLAAIDAASHQSIGSRRFAGSCPSGWTGSGCRRYRGGDGTSLDAPGLGIEGEEMAWCCTEGSLPTCPTVR